MKDERCEIKNCKIMEKFPSFGGVPERRGGF